MLLYFVSMHRYLLNGRAPRPCVMSSALPFLKKLPMQRKKHNSFPSQGPFVQSFILRAQPGAMASDGLFWLQPCVDVGFCLALIENP